MPAISLSSANVLIDCLEPRVLFSDIDGTLVGHNGSLFAGFDGSPTLETARALLAANEAGLKIVLMSGRPQSNVLATARLLGIADAIMEMGTALAIDGETELLWGAVPQGIASTPAQTMKRSGALEWLLDRYRSCLEPHEPLPQERQGTILLRGQLQIAESNAALVEAGFGWAHLVDNGRFNRPFSHLGPNRTHAYHLAPAGISKATTASRYLARRGLGQMHAAAIGDAPSDLELADEVGAMFLVANGAWAIDENERRPIIMTEGSAGCGWAEAVAALLARR